MRIINDCIIKTKSDSNSITVDESMLQTDIMIIDYCLECISDELARNGFDENSEPNAYGLILEDVIGCLLDFRYRIED